MKIDLRDRCAHCLKIPRGKARIAEYQRYKPFCSYHCQQWATIYSAQAHLDALKEKGVVK